MANQLTRLDPFSDLVRFDPFRGMDELFQDFNLRPIMRNMEAQPRIKMDVSESDKAYQVHAEIPGVNKNDIKVAVEGNRVSINAETKSEKDVKQGETIVRSERYYGSMSRSFTLSQDIDEQKVVAKYHDGILDLELPKKSGGGNIKQITIN